MAVVELFDRICKKGTLPGSARWVNGVLVALGARLGADWIESNALGQDEENIAPHRRRRGQRWQVRRMADPGLDVRRASTHETFGEPAKRVKPDHVRCRGLNRTKRAREQSRRARPEGAPR